MTFADPCRYCPHGPNWDDQGPDDEAPFIPGPVEAPESGGEIMSASPCDCRSFYMGLTGGVPLTASLDIRQLEAIREAFDALMAERQVLRFMAAAAFLVKEEASRAHINELNIEALRLEDLARGACAAIGVELKNNDEHRAGEPQAGLPPVAEAPDPRLAYRVIHQSKCAACAGSGMVQHPAWTEFWEPWRDAEGKVNPPNTADKHELYEARAVELGYSSQGILNTTTWKTAMEAMPPEEIDCGECDGTGYIRREVPLVEALKELGVR